MTTLSRLYQISVIVVAAFALLLSSTGMVEAWTWSEYVKCPIDFSKALSHTRSAVRGGDIGMEYCYLPEEAQDMALAHSNNEIAAIYGYGGFGEDDVETIAKDSYEGAACISMQGGRADYPGYSWYIDTEEAVDIRLNHKQHTHAWSEGEIEACQRVLNWMSWWPLRELERCESEDQSDCCWAAFEFHWDCGTMLFE